MLNSTVPLHARITPGSAARRNRNISRATTGGVKTTASGKLIRK